MRPHFVAQLIIRFLATRFINLEVPALTDKWYGESQKLAAAVFTLALKLQPCIIFIDEIDSFLRARSSHDHEATAMMKAQFMMLWDGLSSARHCQVVVMGATNRPSDVDKAILRRMPAMFQVGLPSVEKRKQILNLVLEREVLCSDVDIEVVAKRTAGFSGSDLRELCRTAAMYRVREMSLNYIQRSPRASGVGSSFPVDLRSIRMSDFLNAIEKTHSSKILASSLLESETLD